MQTLVARLTAICISFMVLGLSLRGAPPQGMWEIPPEPPFGRGNIPPPFVKGD